MRIVDGNEKEIMKIDNVKIVESADYIMAARSIPGLEEFAQITINKEAVRKTTKKEVVMSIYHEVLHVMTGTIKKGGKGSPFAEGMADGFGSAMVTWSKISANVLILKGYYFRLFMKLGKRYLGPYVEGVRLGQMLGNKCYKHLSIKQINKVYKEVMDLVNE